MDNGDLSYPSSDPDVIRRFATFLVRFVANTAVDPHRYFEQRYLGEIRNARNNAELTRVVRGLIDWVMNGGLDQSGCNALDAQLHDEGLPTLQRMQQTLG